MAVATAAPGSPIAGTGPHPKRKSGSSAALSARPTTEVSRGVFVSPCPRQIASQHAWPVIAKAAAHAIREYVTPCAAAAPLTPALSKGRRAKATTTTPSAIPTTTDHRTACDAT